jgi:hypothetical protein
MVIQSTDNIRWQRKTHASVYTDLLTLPAAAIIADHEILLGQVLQQQNRCERL